MAEEDLRLKGKLRELLFFALFASAISIMSLVFSMVAFNVASSVVVSEWDEVVSLDDENMNLEGVVDFLCTSTVFTSYHPALSGKPLYVSTWEDGVVPHSQGTCVVKHKTKWRGCKDD